MSFNNKGEQRNRRYWNYLKNPPIGFALKGWWALVPPFLIALIYCHETYIRDLAKGDPLASFYSGFFVYGCLGVLLAKGYKSSMQEAGHTVEHDTEDIDGG